MEEVGKIDKEMPDRMIVFQLMHFVEDDTYTIQEAPCDNQVESKGRRCLHKPVSYTHLTLPTILRV